MHFSKFILYICEQLKIMKVAISPITTTDFTKGKEYEILKDLGDRFVTRNDHNEIVCCSIENSEFINNQKFQIKKK